jgi:hypothetical protein
MNKKDFLKYFKLVEKMLKDNDKKQNAIEALCVGSYPVYNGDHVFEYIKLLSYSVGDKSELIDWYVIENDMGKGKLKIILKDSKAELLIDTPSKLYDIIKTI